MDLAGLVCMAWGVLFTIACMQFKFTTWQEWDVTQTVTEDTWNNTPKGLALAPLVIALVWRSEKRNFSFENIPFVFWERVFLTVIGIGVGYLVSRAFRHLT